MCRVIAVSNQKGGVDSILCKFGNRIGKGRKESIVD